MKIDITQQEEAEALDMFATNSGEIYGAYLQKIKSLKWLMTQYPILFKAERFAGHFSGWYRGAEIMYNREFRDSPIRLYDTTLLYLSFEMVKEVVEEINSGQWDHLEASPI